MICSYMKKTNTIRNNLLKLYNKHPCLLVGGLLACIVIILCVVAYGLNSNSPPNIPNSTSIIDSSEQPKQNTKTDKKTAKKNSKSQSKSNNTDSSSGTTGSTSTNSSAEDSSGSTSTSSTATVPAYTTEKRSGQPLEDFPFPIMTDPPHSVHDPVSGFASTTRNSGQYTFTLPGSTNDIGLYGEFWLSPTPPTSKAKLVGIRIKNAVSNGTMDNSLAVFSLLDRNTEDNALGSVTGAYQGLDNQLVAVILDNIPAPVIELRFTSPVANSGGRFVLAIDSENLPTGNPTIYPTTISVDAMQWLWTAN